MQRQTVPTSPQYPQTEKNRSPKWSLLGWVFLSVLSGGLAGLGVAGVVLTQYNFQTQQIVVDTSGSTAVTEVATVLSPSVRERSVSIVNDHGELVGVGLMVTTDGVLVTTHALQSGERVLNSKRQELQITLTQQDPLTGLYILKSDQSGLPVVTWVTADELSVGQRVFILQLTPVQADWVAEREVASLHTGSQAPQSLQQLTDWVQLDSSASVMSGSPVVGLNGHVLGLMLDDHSIIPGNIIDAQLQYFIEHSTFRSLPRLTTQSLFYSATEGEAGFLVTTSEVEALKVGDVITGVDGMTLTKVDQLLPLMLRIQEGQTVKIDLKRGEQAIQVDLTL